MAIRFLVDSASDITPMQARELGIVHVPLVVTFGDTPYLDGVELTHRQFFEKLIESDALPTTSQVPPAIFADAFRPLVEKGDTVIALIVSSSLSGTYQSACIAAEEFDGKVFVVDTENVCIGQRMLVLRGLELLREGKSAEEIVACLNREKKDVRLLAVLDTLEYLKKGGRISAATAFAGGLLSIKPVVMVKDGTVELCGKARGSKNGNNLLRKLIAESNGVDFNRPYCLGYSGLSDHLLKKYVEDSTELWCANTKELPIYTVGSIIGTHVGPGAIAVSYFEKGNE